MPPETIGLDIGGANLKAATSSGRAIAHAFELWKHPDRLARELADVVAELGAHGPVAVTMTGELCDCFQTKRDGVRHILSAVAESFSGRPTRVWSTDGEFLTLDAAAGQPLAVAAANWHALATLAGRFASTGFAILVDMGSTTTDVIPIRDGRPAPAGRTDPERLKTRELVYTGARRTSVCALESKGVAAELFATTHDVYVRLGILPEEPDNRRTSDGRPMTVAHAHARLARMLGGDPEITAESETAILARAVFERQKERIVRALKDVATREDTPPSAIVLAGSGEVVARVAVEAFANEFDRSPRVSGNRVRLISLAEQLGPGVSDSACAYAVAILAAERLK